MGQAGGDVEEGWPSIDVNASQARHHGTSVPWEDPQRRCPLSHYCRWRPPVRGTTAPITGTKLSHPATSLPQARTESCLSNKAAGGPSARLAVANGWKRSGSWKLRMRGRVSTVSTVAPDAEALLGGFRIRSGRGLRRARNIRSKIESDLSPCDLEG